MPKPSLTDLTMFKAVASYRSFQKAADALGQSRSTLSHAMRGLEEQLGVRLLNRTTRSVSLTELGERLLERISPILQELDDALGDVTEEAGHVRGTLRINCSEPVARRFLHSVVPAFLARFPDVELDMVAEGRLVDIVAEGFDAGVRIGEALPQDMIAVPFGGALRFIAVAAPAYLETTDVLSSPEDLYRHVCIRQRLPSGKRYRWEFAKHGQQLFVDVPGALTLDNVMLMVEAASQGLGIAYVPEPAALDAIEDGRLRRVLEDWCPFIPGLSLYFPANRHMPPPLRALVEMLKSGKFSE